MNAVGAGAVKLVTGGALGAGVAAMGAAVAVGFGVLVVEVEETCATVTAAIDFA
jgi:hypothetical protein